MTGEDFTFECIVDGATEVEKTQRTNSEVPKSDYFFGEDVRMDITSRKGRGMNGLEHARKGRKAAMEAYSVQRRKSKAPLVPPKPKEFDMAYSISALRAWFGIRSMPAVSGSGFSKLIVGGSI